MNNRLQNEEHHFQMVEEGVQHLELILPDYDKKIFDFSYSMCKAMVKILGKERIAHEFNLEEFENQDFVQQLSLRLDFGVPVFLVRTNLYSTLYGTSKLLSVVAALNFCMAQWMATIFNELNLRRSTTSCVYANEALFIIVNRSMGRFEELSLPELKKFSDDLY